ncbi:Chromatin structure-remodeling complex protein rsc9 [Friedmanniomyces endolithicus]|nr:Chromatin structure-remodeling complex protein rsc9 [Friedmanniomyces endolithicus]
MAPKRGESVGTTVEYKDFMEKLGKYHEKRGTTLEAEPKVGVRHIDLLKLYKRVVEEGGYDLCSDTKAKPLMWRRLAEEFVGKNVYTAAQAFQIKNVYYKNLCAYEITHHWEKEAPPKEILEEVTAKGGNVMGRTLENYARPPAKEETSLSGGDGGGNGEGSDASPEQKTPKFEKAEDAEDPGSASGRTARGLRHAPSQRVLFQPDLTAQGRQTRGVLNTTNPPTLGASVNGIPSAGMPNGPSTAASSTLASYEPSQSYPLSLKPVITPANNPDHYRQQLKRKADSAMGPLEKKYKNIMLPGTGFVGPNIYVRAQLALQSGIEEEEMYALHHLVKISHERGDKYRFDQFPGLAETLVRKCLSVCGLFYDVDWDISYDEDTMDADDETLDGLRGSSDIVRRLKNMIPRVTDDGMQDAAFQSQLGRIMEAGLVLRNMCLQGENAKYLVNIPTTREYLAVVLNLPQHPAIVELQHYALDTAEQLLVWCDLGPRDALYQALIAQLYEHDRGAIVIALRTIARIAMNLTGPKRLDDVPVEVLRKVQGWLLVEDEELKGACLDFLFQFTSSADNVEILLHRPDVAALAQHLSGLLLFAAKEERRQPNPTHSDKEAEEDDGSTSTKVHPIPRLSRPIVELLLQLEEPERSAEWLRMCFVSSPISDMTQIALWHAYQATFGPYNTMTRNHLVAGEFIKNVSTTFAGATAQVAGGNKYVIRGIRPRGKAMEMGALPGGTKLAGSSLGRCGWVVQSIGRDPETGEPAMRESECGECFRRGDMTLLNHVLGEHLQVPRKKLDLRETMEAEFSDGIDSMKVDSTAPGEGPASAMAMANGHTSATGTPAPPPAQSTTSLAAHFDFAAADQNTYRCRWAGSCTRSSLDFDFATNGGHAKISRTALFARHVQTHLPENLATDDEAARARHNLTPEAAGRVVKAEKVMWQGLVDEKGDAMGVALSAALVLRNLAKFMPAKATAITGLPRVADGGLVAESRSNGHASKHDDVKGAGLLERDIGGGGLMAEFFDEVVVERLVWAMTHCKPIHSYVGSILRAVGRGGGSGGG